MAVHYRFMSGGRQLDLSPASDLEGSPLSGNSMNPFPNVTFCMKG